MADVRAETRQPMKTPHGGSGFVGATESARAATMVRGEATDSTRTVQTVRGEAGWM